MEPTTPTKTSVWIKIGISFALTVLVLVQLAKGLQLSAETVALVVLAVLPWLSTIVESVELQAEGNCSSAKFVRLSPPTRSSLRHSRESSTSL